MTDTYEIGTEPTGLSNLQMVPDSTEFGKDDLSIVRGHKIVGEIPWPASWQNLEAEFYANQIKEGIEAEGHRCLWVKVSVDYQLIWDPPWEWPYLIPTGKNVVTVNADYAIYGLHDQIALVLVIGAIILTAIGIFTLYQVYAPILWYQAGIPADDIDDYTARTSWFNKMFGGIGEAVGLAVGVFIVIAGVILLLPYTVKRALKKGNKY